MRRAANIRRARANDRTAIFGLMEDSHREATFPMPAIDRDRCMAHIDGCVSQGFAAVAVAGEFVVGALLGAETGFWFSREKRVSDVFTYVLPAHRKSGIGLALYRSFRDWAHERGAKIMLGQLTGVEPERMEKLFDRFGLKKMGSTYIEV